MTHDPVRRLAASEDPRRRGGDAERLLLTCVVCGRPLAERKCKLYCPDPRCGYFLSCADFY